MKNKILYTVFLAIILVISSQTTYAAFPVKLTSVKSESVIAQYNRIPTQNFGGHRVHEDYGGKRGGEFAILSIVFLILFPPLAICFGAFGVKHNCRYRTLAKIGMVLSIAEMSIVLLVSFRFHGGH